MRIILEACSTPVADDKAIVGTITAFSFDRTDAFSFDREADAPAVSGDSSAVAGCSSVVAGCSSVVAGRSSVVAELAAVAGS